MERTVEFVPLLSMVQEHISGNYSAALNDADKRDQLKSYITKFLQDNDYAVDGMSTQELIEKLYSEMAEYSVLTPYLNNDGVEEINVNAWNDIAITYTDGRIEKLKDHFYSSQHATDIVKRLLHHSGMIIDNANPLSQGHLPNNTRITAMKSPIVDEDVGVAVSIRLLHPSRVNRTQIIEKGTATAKMFDFLAMCVNYGVSTLVVGATSSGKTTFMNALLNTIAFSKRIFTIESGARELSLVVTDKEGNVLNNVVHTLSRPSDNESYNITQENLVVASLRYNPDIIVVGEIRDVEAIFAVEASRTGHTVVSTVHGYAGEEAHERVTELCQKSVDTDFQTLKRQVGRSFPVVAYAHRLENNERKIMDISECEIMSDGSCRYHTLFRYNIVKNEISDSKVIIEGYFEQPEIMSEKLRNRLLQFGVPQNVLQKFLAKGAEYE